MVFMIPNNTGNSANKSAAHTSLENRIRLKRGVIAEDERKQQSYNGEIVRIQGEIRHIIDAMSRIELEAKSFAKESNRERIISQQAEDSGRLKQQEINRKNDEMRKLEHELSVIRKQAEEKERVMHEVKESLRQLVKEREDFHKQFESESFGAKEGGSHAHEKEVRLHQLEIEKNGKEAEIARKEQEIAHLKKDLVLKGEDLEDLQKQLEQLDGVVT
jgi:chromosome segregation ATPase